VANKDCELHPPTKAVPLANSCEERKFEKGVQALRNYENVVAGDARMVCLAAEKALGVEDESSRSPSTVLGDDGGALCGLCSDQTISPTLHVLLLRRDSA
jgi:hypothetical protein